MCEIQKDYLVYKKILIGNIFLRLRIGLLNLINTYSRLEIKCILIEFTIPNQSLICISEYFETSFKNRIFGAKKQMNLCVVVVNSTGVFIF